MFLVQSFDGRPGEYAFASNMVSAYFINLASLTPLDCLTLSLFFYKLYNECYFMLQPHAWLGVISIRCFCSIALNMFISANNTSDLFWNHQHTNVNHMSGLIVSIIYKYLILIQF